MPSYKFLIPLILLIACKKNKIVDTNQSSDFKNCIVSDKSKLEDLQFFPAEYAINQDISALPRDDRSDAIINLIGNPGIHADFGSGLYEGTPIGIPYVVVCKDQSKFPIFFRENNYDGNYGDESDAGPYAIPLTAPIEANGIAGNDNHVLAVDIDNKVLYELYNVSLGKNQWEASAGTKWDLNHIPSRPIGWTSVDAAGLPLLPLLVRYEEVLKGKIDHALRFTLINSKVTNGFTAPANHKVNGKNTNANAPTPMGLRLRLKAGFDISGYSPKNQIILNAMKKYGIILADIGSDFFVTGAPEDRWDNDDLQNLKKVKASDFEVIKMGEILK